MMVLCRRVLAELIADLLEKRTGMKVIKVYDFKQAGGAANLHQPGVVLVEIPERYGYPALDTLKVCKEIKEASPGCKIILLCPEQDLESVDICVDALRRCEIEDFMFYEASKAYLSAKMESMCPGRDAG